MKRNGYDPIWGTDHRSWDDPRGVLGVSGAVRGTDGYSVD